MKRLKTAMPALKRAIASLLLGCVLAGFLMLAGAGLSCLFCGDWVKGLSIGIPYGGIAGYAAVMINDYWAGREPNQKSEGASE